MPTIIEWQEYSKIKLRAEVITPDWYLYRYKLSYNRLLFGCVQKIVTVPHLTEGRKNCNRKWLKTSCPKKPQLVLDAREKFGGIYHEIQAYGYAPPLFLSIM